MRRNRFIRFLRHSASRSLLDVFSGSGKVVLISCAVCLFAFWGYPFVWLFSGFLTLLGISWFLNVYMTPKLAVQIQGDSITYAGEDAFLQVVLENKSWRFARDLTLSCTEVDRTWRCLDGAFCVGTIAPGKQVAIQLRFKTLERGGYDWPRIRIESNFPFGLCSGKQFAENLSEIYVAPNRNAVAAYENFQQLTALVGEIVRRNASQGSDYLGSREYVSGSPPGRWDFASWGRLGKPIVREMANENQSTVVVFVDLFVERVSNRKKQLEAFERLLEFAVGLGEHFKRRRCILSFVIPEVGESLALTLHSEESALRCLALCKPIPFASRQTLDPKWPILHFDRRLATLISVQMEDQSDRRSFTQQLFPGHRIDFVSIN